MNRLTKLAVALVSPILVAASAKADLYTIGQTYDLTVSAGIGGSATIATSNPSLGGTYNVFAGILNLTIDGIGTVQGFCIEPFTWALSGKNSYTAAELANAPVVAGATTQLSTAGQAKILTLWDNYFAGAQADATKAAALQLAIWKIVDDFVSPASITTLSSSALALANTYYNSVSGVTSYSGSVSLVAMTNERGQDFVVRQVPDGGTTVLLLGLGLSGLAFLRRRMA